MRTSAFEVFVGALVLLTAALFLAFALNSSRWQGAANSHVYKARFERVDGLSRGTDVRVSGVKVGAVTGFALDPKTYMALVTLSVASDLRLPSDTVAEVSSDGLLGGKYVSLIPGASSRLLTPGATITRTQAAMNFETLIGKFLINSNRPATAPSPALAPSNPAPAQLP